MMVFAFKKEMRTLDFYLVFLQTIFDFSFTGLYSFFYCFIMLFNYLFQACYFGTKADEILYTTLLEKPSAKSSPEWKMDTIHGSIELFVMKNIPKIFLFANFKFVKTPKH